MYKKCTSCGNCVEVKKDGVIVKNRKLDAYCFYCVSDRFATGARKIGNKASWTGRTPKWCPVCEAKMGGNQTVEAEETRKKNQPISIEELREMAKGKPVVVWVECIDQETKNPDPFLGDWEMFDGYSFYGQDTYDYIGNYGEMFVAFREKREVKET